MRESFPKFSENQCRRRGPAGRTVTLLLCRHKRNRAPAYFGRAELRLGLAMGVASWTDETKLVPTGLPSSFLLLQGPPAPRAHHSTLHVEQFFRLPHELFLNLILFSPPNTPTRSCFPPSSACVFCLSGRPPRHFRVTIQHLSGTVLHPSCHGQVPRSFTNEVSRRGARFRS